MKTPAKNSDKKPWTRSKNVPKGGGSSCLCLDNTYHPDCCDSAIYSQGIGRTQA